MVPHRGSVQFVRQSLATRNRSGRMAVNYPAPRTAASPVSPCKRNENADFRSHSQATTPAAILPDEIFPSTRLQGLRNRALEHDEPTCHHSVHFLQVPWEHQNPGINPAEGLFGAAQIGFQSSKQSVVSPVLAVLTISLCGNRSRKGLISAPQRAKSPESPNRSQGDHYASC
jgi:hypothetical protein